MKKTLLILLLSVTTMITACSSSTSSEYSTNNINDRYDRSYKSDYEEGYEKGCADGYDMCELDNHDSIYDNAYEAGYDNGYENGFSEGYSAYEIASDEWSCTYEEAIQDGFNDGYAEAEYEYRDGLSQWYSGELYLVTYPPESEGPFGTDLTYHKYSYNCLTNLLETNFESYFLFASEEYIAEWNSYDDEGQMKACPYCIGD